MDKRRRMMLGEKTEPLVIFKFGDSALTNGEIMNSKTDPQYEVLDGTVFRDGIIAVGRDLLYGENYEEYRKGNMDIGGIDFTKYKTLYIECLCSNPYYDVFAEDYYIGYGETEGPCSGETGYEDYKNPPREYETLSFDISGVRGTWLYIKATPFTVSEGEIQIKNIWME